MKDCSSAEDTDTDAEDIQCDEPLLGTKTIESMKLERFYWEDSTDKDVETGYPLSLYSEYFPSSESGQKTSEPTTQCCQQPKNVSTISILKVKGVESIYF